MDSSTDKDTEAQNCSIEIGRGTASPISSTSPQASRSTVIRNSVAILRSLRHLEEWLDGKVGFETQGIDRIPEEDKKAPSIANAFLMWWSMSIHVGTLEIGVLGPQFGLDFKQSVAAIVVGVVIGAVCPAFTGTLGPKLGLRGIATARYSFGYHGAKICAVLNVLSSVGFTVVNIVVCGQLLSAVSGYRLSITVGIVIIQVISYLVSLFGFRVIHSFERYFWIMTFVLLCVLLAQAKPLLDSIPVPSPPDTPAKWPTGAFLTFLAINFSSSSGWCTVVSDYYCNYPAATPAWKLPTLTLLGISLPTIFVTTIGSYLGDLATRSPANSAINSAFTSHGLGGLIQEISRPEAWSDCILVLLVFSVLGNNIVSAYSSGLSLQLLGDAMHAVPRFVWSLFAAVVATIMAIAGKDNLANIVSNFLSLLGYWTVSFTVVLFLEDRWFRREKGYRLQDWDEATKLPWGIGAFVAMLTGVLAGGVTGMCQTWWTGPIAREFGEGGGDVGVFLTAAFTAVSYVVVRMAEKRVWGK